MILGGLKQRKKVSNEAKCPRWGGMVFSTEEAESHVDSLKEPKTKNFGRKGFSVM